MGNQNHDAQGRFASGDSSGGKTTGTVREIQNMRALADARKYLHSRTSIRNINPPAMYPNKNPNARMERTDMPIPPHARGVHNATAGKSLGGGKTLAELSAMGATTAKVQPKRG